MRVSLLIPVLVGLAVGIGILTYPKSHYLPHRPLSEIDIQGHQAGTPSDHCPGQYEHRDGDDFVLYCWGKKN